MIEFLTQLFYAFKFFTDPQSYYSLEKLDKFAIHIKSPLFKVTVQDNFDDKEYLQITQLSKFFKEVFIDKVQDEISTYNQIVSCYKGKYQEKYGK